MRGIVYMYEDRASSYIHYVGKTTGDGTAKQLLRKRHVSHLNGFCPFDYVLHFKGDSAYKLRVIEDIETDNLETLNTVISELEYNHIRELRPLYNEVHNTDEYYF